MLFRFLDRYPDVGPELYWHEWEPVLLNTYGEGNSVRLILKENRVVERDSIIGVVWINASDESLF